MLTVHQVVQMGFMDFVSEEALTYSQFRLTTLFIGPPDARHSLVR